MFVDHVCVCVCACVRARACACVRVSFTFYNMNTRITFRRILVSLRKRLSSSTLPCSSVIDDASTLMTKSGVAVTVICILTIGYDVIYYVLGAIGVTAYVVNSPVQKIGILMSTFNSVANPFVYILLMPAFRHSLRKTFHVSSLRCGVVNRNAASEDFDMPEFTAGTSVTGTAIETDGSCVTFEVQ